MNIPVLSLAALTVGFTACQPKPAAAQKHYALTGKVISVNPKEVTANIDASAIPDFMGAMKMDYPIVPASALAALKAGEDITATVNVSEDGSYSLSDIHARPAAAPVSGK